mgnify:CR=1 FL=1
MSSFLDIHIMYSTERSVYDIECAQEHRNLSALSHRMWYSSICDIWLEPSDT